MRSSKVLTWNARTPRLTRYKCNQDTIPHLTETGAFEVHTSSAQHDTAGYRRGWHHFTHKHSDACSRLVSHVSPTLLSRHWNPRGVYEGGGEWERNAVRWKKRRESESEGLLFVRIMPLRCFPRSRRELPGPPPCLKAFFLSSSHPSLSPKESILCPLPSSPQNNRPLLWKKKKKLHSSAPISTCLSLMDPFPFEPVKSTSSLICCLFHIPSACGVGCMDGGNTRDWFCL